MVYRGHVENGVIRLEDSVRLPEGAAVEVHLLQQESAKPEAGTTSSVYERLKEFVGKAEGLPPDASVNPDHYLYGLPKRQ